MPRSLKKGPYVYHKLLTKLEKAQSSNRKSVIKTWSRSSMIIPDMVGQTIAVHNENHLFLYLLRKTWLVTSWENLLQLERIEVILETGNKEKWKQEQY